MLAAVAVGMPVAALAGPRTEAGGGDFRLADARIGESSGLVLSRRHPHVVWTANDSGDSARVFAVDTRTGTTVGVHRFGADVQDVEALAMTPDGRLLVGDVGDNGSRRTSVRVYWFEEPELGQTSGPAASWELRYPDGPHDAESLAVNPLTGRVYVVTKGLTGGVYALPANPSRTGVNRLTRVGAAPSVATDAVYLADGSALAVRTYLALVLLDARDFSRVGSTPLPPQPQGETISLAPDGHGLLVGSEGVHTLVQEVAIPALPLAAHSAPGATTSAAPPSSGAASSPVRVAASPTRPDGGGEPDGSVAALNPGVLLAGLGACALLVLLAVVVTRMARRGRR